MGKPAVRAAISKSLVLALLLMGCTRAVDTSKITIQVPSNSASDTSQKTQSSQSVGVLSGGSKWGMAPPVGLSQIKCYAVAVSAKDLSSSITCRNLNNSFVQSYDQIAGVFAPGEEITIEVPSGPQRTISLIGFNTNVLSNCKDLGEKGGVMAGSQTSPPVILGAATQDLVPGSQDIKLDISNFANSVLFEDCDEKPFASSTIVEALALGGVPGGITSATTLVNIPMRGFNADEYAYQFVSGGSCAASVYLEPFVTFTSAPNFTYDFSALADGAMSLCIVGRNSVANSLQTYPNIYTWTKDTVSPVSLSLSVSSTTTVPNPTLTINNSEAGTIIKIYSGVSGTPIEYCNDLFYVGSVSATATTTTHAVTGLTDRTHYFTAKALDAAGNSSPCSNTAQTILDTSAPGAPLVRGQAGGVFETLSPFYSWDASTETGSGLLRYEVAVGSASGTITDIMGWTPVSSTIQNYTYASGAFNESLNYNFSVRAVDNAGNVSPVTTKSWRPYITSPLWQQQAYIKANNPTANDMFGWDVAFDGDRMVVSARYEDAAQTSISLTGPVADEGQANSGAVYVYKRSVSSTWALEAYLKPDNTLSNQDFGYSVDISGDTIVVGSPMEKSAQAGVSATGSTTFTASPYGAVYTFKHNGTGWVMENYIKPLGPTAGHFGHDVSIDGDTLVATAPYYTSPTDSGAAYVFNRSGGNWTQFQTLRETVPSTGNRFGWSVDMHQDKIAVGALHSSLNYGNVQIFELQGASWTTTASVSNTVRATNDKFGNAISIYGDRLAVGAFQEKFNAVGVQVGWTTYGTSVTPYGAVYIFEKVGGIWNQAAYVKPPVLESGQNFGYSVSLFENKLVVGSPGTSSGKGAVYVYKIPATGVYTANRKYQAGDQTVGSYFGSSVAISNSAIAVGGYTEKSDSGMVQNGSTYLFTQGVSTDYGAAWLLESLP